MKHWTSLSEGLFIVGYIKGHNQRGPVSALARSSRVPLTFSVCFPPFQYIFDSKGSHLQPFFSGLFSGYQSQSKLLGVCGLFGQCFLKMTNGCNHHKSSEAQFILRNSPGDEAGAASEALPVVSLLLGFILPYLLCSFIGLFRQHSHNKSLVHESSPQGPCLGKSTLTISI